MITRKAEQLLTQKQNDIEIIQQLIPGFSKSGIRSEFKPFAISDVWDLNDIRSILSEIDIRLHAFPYDGSIIISM